MKAAMATMITRIGKESAKPPVEFVPVADVQFDDMGVTLQDQFLPSLFHCVSLNLLASKLPI